MMVPLPLAQHFALKWTDRLKWRAGDGKGLEFSESSHSLSLDKERTKNKKYGNKK